MGDLPENVLRYDVVKVDYKRRKVCKCNQAGIILDYQNRAVECAECGAILDPYDALYRLALRYEHSDTYWEQVLEQRKKIASYKPHLVVIKELERKYRANKFSLVPCCPHCSEPFDLTELNHWCNRAFLTQRKEQAENGTNND